MEANIDYLVKKDFEDFKEVFFEKLQNITENIIIIETLNKIKNNNKKEKKFNVEKYIETQLYNIGGKEYMIDTKNGIVFSGKRADIVEILSDDELKKLKVY
tara:strand:- start:129 stop:431 length:303 start_codon:yes stop_codon:yes gene_type:complete